MAIDVSEKLESRRQGRGRNPFADLLFDCFWDGLDCTLAQVELRIHEALVAEADPFFDIYGGGFLLLPRDQINITDRVSDRHWRATVSYRGTQQSPLEPTNSLDYEWSFRLGGGTRHIVRALANTRRAPLLPHPNEKGNAPKTRLIGINEDDSVEGTDIPDDVWTWSETHVKYLSEVGSAYELNLRNAWRHWNLTTFRGWRPGEVLFWEIAARRERGAPTVSLTYEFRARKNVATLDLFNDVAEGEPGYDPTFVIPGTDDNPAVLGWDYVWVQPKRGVDPVTKTEVLLPRFVYVDRVLFGYDFNHVTLGLQI